MLFTRIAATIVIWLVAACTSTPPPTAPGPVALPKEPVAAFDPALLGANCAEGQACTVGAMCKAYYGFAGASGPEFKTCELRCDEDKTACPAGTKCITIADGAGTVCRPTED